MPYTADKPTRAETPEQLRARIPGWGVDLDPRDRPSFPREVLIEDRTGAHWDFPERQPEKYPRERSIEHGMLPPVFGTVAPLHGVSGRIRRLAYDKYSEGHSFHWLLLILGDRVDSLGASVTSVLRGRPDDPVTETGVLSELSYGGLSSRLGRNRVDLKHQVMDPFIVTAPWVARAGVLYLAVRGLRRKR